MVSGCCGAYLLADVDGLEVSKFDELDAAIVARIANGGPHPMHCPYCQVASHNVMRSNQDAMRVIDGRMTALKKAGRIAYSRRLAKWEIL